MAENQHYVPQFLLRNFCRKEQVHIFELGTQKIFRTNIRNIMAERDYNVTSLQNGYFIDFENRFTYIESLAGPVITKIIETEDVTALSADDLAKIHIFVVAQNLRSKVNRVNFEHLNKYIKGNFQGISTNDFPEFFTDAEYEKYCQLKMITENLTEFAKPMLPKYILLLKKDCPGSIYISDTPVVLHNSKDFGPYGNIGIGVPHIEIYLPISPELVIAFVCPHSVSEIRRLQEELSLTLDKKKKAAWLNGEAQSPHFQSEISAQYAELERSKKYSERIIKAKKAPITLENLMHLNSLQVIWAHRFIAASQPDFNFASQCLSENPQWTKAPRWEIN